MNGNFRQTRTRPRSKQGLHSEKKSSKMPRAYRDDVQDFYGRKFLVTPAVLIPRPETEQIVDAVLALMGLPFLPGVMPESAKLSKSCKVLDVGTGSGCIGITIKLAIPESEVTLVDIDEMALEVTKENVERLQVEVNLKKSDLLTGVDDAPDVVVANLPYVDKNWDWLDHTALGFEPELALFAEDGGLALIKKLFDQLKEKIDDGWRTKFLLLEADLSQHQEIIRYAKKRGWQYLQTRGFILEFSH